MNNLKYLDLVIGNDIAKENYRVTTKGVECLFIKYTTARFSPPSMKVVPRYTYGHYATIYKDDTLYEVLEKDSYTVLVSAFDKVEVTNKINKHKLLKLI